ncbi:MAG: tetratricopeptide repeat protein [Armatimonadetes bacterium]|nr:tetratricopeptide repeat protein [Armatimonadota bacterium]
MDDAYIEKALRRLICPRPPEGMRERILGKCREIEARERSNRMKRMIDRWKGVVAEMFTPEKRAWTAAIACGVMLLIFSPNIVSWASVEYNVKRGEACYRAKDYAGALERYQELVKDVPDGPETTDWYRKIAACLLAMGKPVEAATASKKAAELDAKRAADKQSAADFSGMLKQAEQLMGSQKYSEALAIYQKLALEDRASPNLAHYHRRIGDCWFNLKDYRKSLSAYDDAIRADTNQDALRNDRSGHAYIQMYLASKTGNWELAVKEYSALITDYPDAPEITSWYGSLSSCMRSARRPLSEVMEKVDEGIQVAKAQAKPEVVAQLMQYRASYLEEGGDKSEAVKAWKELIAAFPNSPLAITWKCGLGRTYVDMGDFASAEPLLQEVVEKDDGKSGDYALTGTLYMAIGLSKQGKTKEALDLIEEVRKNPKFRQGATWIRAELFYKYLNDWKRAVPYLEEFLEEYPDDPVRGEWAKRRLVEGLVAMDRPEEAVKRIKEYFPTRSEPWIGEMLFKAGEYHEAATCYTAYLKKADLSGDEKAKGSYELARCYWRLGYTKLATDYMKKVVRLYPDSRWAKEARGQMYLWGVSSTSNER